jgi:HSP20 family protein
MLAACSFSRSFFEATVMVSIKCGLLIARIHGFKNESGAFALFTRSLSGTLKKTSVDPSIKALKA